MKEVHIYTEIDDASGNVSPKGYGYVLEFRGENGNLGTKQGFGRIINTNHVATLCAVIEAMERITEPCEITIHARDTYVLNMIEHNLESWAENNFSAKGGRTVANRAQWRHLWEAKEEHGHKLLVSPGGHVYSSWLRTEIAKWKEEKRKEGKNVKTK